MPRSIFQIHWGELKKPTYWVAPLVASALFVVFEHYSFLFFHIIAEGITIIIAGMMAVTSWQAYDLSRNRLFTFLGYGFFWVGIIDVAHTLTYKGMSVLPVETANPATQLWIAGRFLEAAVCLLALYRLENLYPPGKSFFAIGMISMAVIAAVWGGYFPNAYVEGAGLTPFKIVSEYVIMGMFGVCLILLGHKREQLPPSVVAPLGMAFILSIGSELAFTFYVDVYDLSNMVGHIFKVFAFWFVLIAIVRTTFAQPFEKLQTETILQQTTERELRESEEHLRTIMESTQDAIVMINHLGLVMFWNAAAERMFGYSREEAIGVDVHSMLAPPEDLGTIRDRLSHFAQTGTGPVIGATISLDARHKDGRQIPVELSVSAIHHQNQWAAIATARDLTERIEAERHLRQMQKSEAIESMAAGIAHDFKNMLLPIISLTGMCLKSLPQDSREHLRLEKVLEAAQRAADLAKRVLAFSREETPAVVETNLSDLVTTTVEFLRSTTLKTIVIVDEIEPNLTACIDAEQIRNVIVNIGTNAADAMEGKTGTIRFTLARHTVTVRESRSGTTLLPNTDYALLAVTDEGTGMSEAVMSRVFDPFFTTKEVGKGTGLGLPVAHSIVEKHHGTMRVKSTPGKGSTFMVYLPLIEPGQHC